MKSIRSLESVLLIALLPAVALAQDSSPREVAVAHWKELQRQFAELNAELDESGVRNRELEERQRKLVAEMDRATRVLIVCGLMEEEHLVEDAAVEGIVTAVKEEFCEISIGSDDGARVGQQLDVFRDEINVGRIVIRKLKADRAVGEVSPETMVKLEKGDRVRTSQKPVPKEKAMVNGIVTAVKRRFCELSRGSDDGLKVGQQLDVFRDGLYIGRVVIRKTNPDRAVGESLSNAIRSPPLEKGDRVRTRVKTTMPEVENE